MRINSPGRTFFDGLMASLGLVGLAGGKKDTRPIAYATDGRTFSATFDDFGVPTIKAETSQDLFFGQGYITAKQRLFQMDYNRHGVRGRICELLGDRPLPWQRLTVLLKERSTFDVDVMMRSFGLEKAAQESWEKISNESQEIIQAYTAGINTYLAQGHRSLEHRLLGVTPKPWQPVDVMVMFKAIAFELNCSWRGALLGGMLMDSPLSEGVASEILPAFPHHGAHIPGGLGKAEIAKISGALAKTQLAADAVQGNASVPGAGSNGWVVAGAHTVDGKPRVVNDTHLALVAPLPWHELWLEGDGFSLHGYSLAGLPGIGIGGNQKCAWGITAGLVQDTDVFVEAIDPQNPARYKTPEGYAEFETRKEVFGIRGEVDREHMIRSTRHGPVIDVWSHAPQEDHYCLAVQWTGHQPAAEMDALVGMWRANSIEDIHQALFHHGCPTFSIDCADSDGNIATFLAGHLPKRAKDAPLRPLEGWLGHYDWQGIVPFEENPSEVNPARGFLVTANNRVADHDYPYELGRVFEGPERFSRVFDMLEKATAAGIKVDSAQMQGMQTDTLAPWALRMRDAMTQLAGSVEALTQEAVLPEAALLWETWDGQAAIDSAGAALVYATIHEFGKELVKALAGEDASSAFMELGSLIASGLEAVCCRPEAFAAPLGRSLPELARDAFSRAVQDCQERMGSDATAWRWGDYHQLIVRHRLHDSPLGWFFSIGPEPVPGGPDTVNRGDIKASMNYDSRIGAAMRMVKIPGEPEQSLMVLPGGQSGNRLSKHYDDQLQLFLAGKMRAPKRSGQKTEIVAPEIKSKQEEKP